MNIFSQIDLLSKGTAASWLRGDVINNNLANVDTPNFKRSQVDFESYYRDAINGTSLTPRMTRENHMPFGNSDGTARVTQDNATTMRMDGNNVDVDQEMTEMARNIIYYNTLTTQVSKEFEAMRIAITGR